ncbi:hypothetical protein [Photobacterium sanguinicancri]|uniref:hypothetical protein n=1 Tax=Photobacterium sanguinicancri TaxID=875932 RepID=UPI001EFE73EC|nr:hypothetical protein [Photobacterium sanguinicancri]
MTIVDAKKALKKLKKKTLIQPSRSAKKLMSLGKTLSVRSRLNIDESVKREMKDISHQALVDAVSELATPLNPLLSWFNEGSSVPMTLAFAGGSSTTVKRVMPIPEQSNPKISLARMPLKSPPCKRCPAMGAGLCKCAVKKFGL